MTQIAQAIGVSASTISRELKRNKCKRTYSPFKAQEYADERKDHLPGNRCIKSHVKQLAIKYIKEKQWSPQQVSGYLRRQDISISHETIYGMIRSDKENGGNLYLNCRNRGKYRKRPVGMRTPIPNRTSIHDRPIEADGTRLGDIEMDLIVGKGNKCAILTLTDRKTNFIWIDKLVHGKDPDEIAEAVGMELFPYMRLIKTITTDNGGEFARHERITMSLHGVKVYFADPYSSWQKGSIENANKLIRQYIPKNTDFDTVTQDFVKQVQYKINDRPRRKLNYLSPKEVFFNLIF
jgi:transposase, IS30 family